MTINNSSLWKKNSSLIIVFISINIWMSILFCGLPQDPADPSNTTVNIILRSQSWEQDEQILEDTSGKTIKIGAVLHLPENIDSVAMKITSDGGIVFDTTFQVLQTTTNDTLWKDMLFSTSENKTYTIIVTPYSKPALPPDTASIVIVGKSGPPNNKPSILVTGNAVLRQRDTCILKIQATDSDAAQVLTVSMAEEPSGAQLKEDSIFVWIVPSDFFGEKVVTFTVVDNGTPPLSNSIQVPITVSEVTVNNVPKWKFDSLTVALSDTASYTLDLEKICSDPDSDKISYSLMPGEPIDDSIIGGSYLFSATKAAIGSFIIKIIASDPGKAMDTIIIKLSIVAIATDFTGPVITIVSPSDSANISAPTITLDVICTDVSGIASVVASTGGAPVSLQFIAGHYSANLSNFTAGVYTPVTIIATDASPNANKQQSTITIKYTKLRSIIYNGNGNTGGAPPIDSGKYESGKIVTVKANGGSLTRTGYTFTGWNSAVDGSGATYAAGTDLKIDSSDVTLFAQWTVKPTWQLVYSGNSNTGGKAPDTVIFDQGITVTIADSGTLFKTGFAFSGWNTRGNGDGTSFHPGDKRLLDTVNLTLYAQWTECRYTVTYHGNGNTGGSAPLLSNYLYGTIVSVALPGNLVKIGYTFYSWNTDSLGLGIDYPIGTSITVGDRNVDLFARWAANQYKVTYNGNENTAGNAPASVQKNFNESITILGKGDLVRTGYVFTGWNTKVNGDGKTYEANATMNIEAADVTLYAQWKIPFGMTLILSKDNTFQMGNTNGDATEKPVHTIKFSKNFWLDTTEVTKVLYDSIMQLSYSGFSKFDTDDKSPADFMNWYDCVLYCNARTKASGSSDTVYEYSEVSGVAGIGCRLIGVNIVYSKTGFRLPTEAEWEYACRAGSETEYFWGDDTAKAIDYAWYQSNSENTTQIVAHLKKNNFNIYDMCGNVLEWCNDWYGDYSELIQNDPTGPDGGVRRVARGGCSLDAIRYLRSSYRSYGDPGSGVMGLGTSVYGFRTCLPIK